MAGGSADAFSVAPPCGFSLYDRELISAAADNLWSANVVATASTGASWVDDVGLSLQSNFSKIKELRRKFHRGRQLLVKHLPRDVTEEELREVLSELEIQSITIQAGSARVALAFPEVLEEWDRNAVFSVRGQRVTIIPSPTEMLLCVGRLPMSYNENQFTQLVGAYGEIRRSFLMISERTGESKGYGFVEYVTKEAALHAKNALDGKNIGDSTAVCDWLDSSHLTLRSLHSKCLYVDKLPPNYRNMGEFRSIFSTIINPPYCQIALKNGCPQDWGLVEFLGEEEAEGTQQSLNGYVLHGRRIRIAYYIPGVRAINLYLKLLNDGGNNKGRSALLPDPPAPAVFQQLQSLAKQNPVFAQNLQSIILQQISDAQKGKLEPPQGLHGQGSSNGQNSRFIGDKSQFSPNGSPYSSSTNSLKNAQQTALNLLLATQQMEGGLGGDHLLSAIQASSNLSSLLALSSPQTNSNSLIEPNSGNGFFPPPLMFQNQMKEQYPWNNSGYANCKQGQRVNNSFSSNCYNKSPHPNPSSISPIIDIPMDTNGPKTPPNESLQAVWYSLFGPHSTPPENSGGSSPGTSSPLFMKGARASADSLFSPSKSQFGNRNGSGELQEALSSLLTHPNLFQSPESLSPPPPPIYMGGRQREGFSDSNAALLDLLMQSMKNNDPFPQDAFSNGRQSQQQSWNSMSNSNPPSPIGSSSRPAFPLRSGSNGSSEMSSPRSPTYSPFSQRRTICKESGNGNVSPTPHWNNQVLGSGPMGYGAPRGIWQTNNNNNNPLGIKRKGTHEGGESFFTLHNTHHQTQGNIAPQPTTPQFSPHVHNQRLNGFNVPPSHDPDSYFKKKKKS